MPSEGTGHIDKTKTAVTVLVLFYGSYGVVSATETSSFNICTDMALTVRCDD